MRIDKPQDAFFEMVKRAVDQEIADAVQEAVDKAVEQAAHEARARIYTKVATIGVKIANEFDIQRHGHQITITVADRTAKGDTP